MKNRTLIVLVALIFAGGAFQVRAMDNSDCENIEQGNCKENILDISENEGLGSSKSDFKLDTMSVEQNSKPYENSNTQTFMPTLSINELGSGVAEWIDEGQLKSHVLQKVFNKEKLLGDEKRVFQLLKKQVQYTVGSFAFAVMVSFKFGRRMTLILGGGSWLIGWCAKRGILYYSENKLKIDTQAKELWQKKSDLLEELSLRASFDQQKDKAEQ